MGFQCPECVREGQRSVRQGRPLNFGPSGPVVTYALIGINLAVWALILIAPSVAHLLSLHLADYCSSQGYPRLGFDSAGCAAYGGTFAPGVWHGGPWELITSAFTHQQAWHIATNMISLWMIGPLVEQALGRWRYLVAYLVCGLGGSLLVVAAGPQVGYTLGASGAIFGLLGILVVLFIRRGLPLQQLGSVLALNLVLTFALHNVVSWQGHIGGLLTGLAIGALYAYTPLGRRRRILQR
ncbi:rhomboid family intramembrane serine protease [Nocardioides baekrokdamisoli]|uniref:rhomboid family intramembrane serine protease n=1 Tax=Nocardioides baekrokdamisoli TaxID=1804624 RepID=UPI0013DDDCF7|nr:rhomboid family intramembrane serine protease [Nocardioides baekrokdamisoli]